MAGVGRELTFQLVLIRDRGRPLRRSNSRRGCRQATCKSDSEACRSQHAAELSFHAHISPSHTEQ
jgi:hypothetical protein